MDTRAKLKPKIDFIQSTADPAVFAKKLTQVALRRAVLTRTVDQIFNPDERDEIEEEMQESDHIVQMSPDSTRNSGPVRNSVPVRRTLTCSMIARKDFLNKHVEKWGLEIERVYIKDLLLPENIQRSIEETNEKKRLEDINLQIDEKRAVSKAQTRVSF